METQNFSELPKWSFTIRCKLVSYIRQKANIEREILNKHEQSIEGINGYL